MATRSPERMVWDLLALLADPAAFRERLAELGAAQDHLAATTAECQAASERAARAQADAEVAEASAMGRVKRDQARWEATVGQRTGELDARERALNTRELDLNRRERALDERAEKIKQAPS